VTIKTGKGLLVNVSWYWKYGSTTDYFTKEKGLLDLVILK
jgi:hypothetical protein